LQNKVGALIGCSLEQLTEQDGAVPSANVLEMLYVHREPPMKKLLIALLAVLSTAPAYADGWHGRGWERGSGWGWGDSWIVPALIGGAVVYDLAQPQTVYIQPAPVYAPVYAPAAVQQYWYFCAAANAYYPYVSSCPNGWQAVPATPPANLPGTPYGAPAR
jgi:hypothetical protein